MSKILYTKETNLSQQDIEKLMKNLASDNIITTQSDISTYPIYRLKKNAEYISLVYTLLSDHIKIGLPIHPAGEWILDNFYIIEKSAKTVEKELTRKKYISLPGLKNNGFARVYYLANEIISNTDGRITEDELKNYLIAYQTQRELKMEEVWSISLFLQISLIEKIRHICEKICISQMQKFKAYNIAKSLIEEEKVSYKKIPTINIANSSYPFIEHMSYKLKKYGSRANTYLEIFEEQVAKIGMKVEDVINREHYDIAVKSLSMKNAITSLKTISRLDLIKIFKDVNVVEQILRQDPSKIYNNMDLNTKTLYRTKILEIAKKTKVSEIFIAKEILDLANKNIDNQNEKKSHIGYYLIDDGEKELFNKLGCKSKKEFTSKEKSKIYIASIYLITILSCMFFIVWIKWYAIILFIPIQNVITQIMQYAMSKVIKPKIIPKMDYQDNIPKNLSTMVVIPAILKSEKDIEKIANKMEVYYLANKSENLYFTLLGDCEKSTLEETPKDEIIIEKGKKKIKELCDKYGNIFFFTYRKRIWSNCEMCYMGWERKRGMINQFNEFLKTGKSNFRINTCKKNLKIKYVITLDEDTNLILNSAFELIGAASHILNKPEVNKIKNIVEKGYAVITPRIGIDISSARKSIFSRLFAGNGGIDLYSSAISDIYQDNFDEGIYTGKGIYDLDVFYNVLKNEIPENTLLSHDLLEGCYLRCALASDIMLIDNYPSSYLTYKIRKNRWIRGDIQVLKWLKSEISVLSKYKICDNVSRNLNELFIFISLMLALICGKNYFSIIVPILILAFPMFIKLLNNFINKKDGEKKHKLFAPNFSKWNQAIYKFLIDIAILPDTALLELCSSIKAIYRMKISHNHLLEWVTSDEAELSSKSDVKHYAKSMLFQIIISMLFLVLSLKTKNYLSLFFSIYWLFAFLLMWALGRKNENKVKLSNDEKKYLIDIAKRTWKYFKNNTLNYLPVDNYQKDRKEKKALRTSPTNIGLYMLSVIASYDLGFETKENAIKLLYNIINTISDLPKWNGHLYNWYNIKTLQPISPLDISSVDSGNFIRTSIHSS